MADRETKEIKVGEHSFIVKTYVTAREQNAVQQAYFKGTKVEVAGNQPRISEFNPGVQYEVRVELIRQMVVAMDDSSEDIVGRCENLPSSDFDALAAQLDEIAASKKNG
jgi:hypothetical protein